MKRTRTALLTLTMLAMLAPLALAAEPRNPRNQLQNSSFENDWLVGSILTDRRFNILQRAEVGYNEADGVIDHWMAPAALFDNSVARTGKRSVRLSGNLVKQSVRIAMRQPDNTNPTGTQSNLVPFEPEIMAKLEPRVVRGGAWIKAQGAAEGGTIVIQQAGKSASVAIPSGTYDWKLIEVSSNEPWPAADRATITIGAAGGTIWVDDAYLAEEPRGKNLVPNADFEKLDNNWPAGFDQPRAFWWYRYDYYAFTGWSHDGGYGGGSRWVFDLVPAYKWRGYAAVDQLVRHSGNNSVRMVAYPGDNFGIVGPVVEVQPGKPFEIAAWVKADQIHEIELMAIDPDTNQWVVWDTDCFAGMDGQGIDAGSKGQGTYGWTYVRKVIFPREPHPKKLRPMIAVRGFDGLIIEKNIVGTAWFDDLTIIQRDPANTEATAEPPARSNSVAITHIDLGDRMWGKNTARVSLENANGAQVKLTITSPSGKKQELSGAAKGATAVVELPYQIDELCQSFHEQYKAEFSVTAGGKTQTQQLAFGTPSSLLTTRVSHQFLFPEETLVVAANLNVTHQSLDEVAKVVVEITDPSGKSVGQAVVENPGQKLPVIVEGATKALHHLNIDRVITLSPDLSKLTVRPWSEATRDYTVNVHLYGKDGKELAKATGASFGRITHFDPPPLTFNKIAGDHFRIQGKVTINDEHFILVDGKPFFPVYFGEYGDTFRETEGINIGRDQIEGLGINPRRLSDEDKAKYGMSPEYALGEWDFRFGDMTPAKIRAANDKLRADNPGMLISSNYDMVSHLASRRPDQAAYFVPAFDITCIEASFASYVPNLRVDWFPLMEGRNCAILIGFENYYFVSFEELRYRSYLSVMRGAAGLGLIPSRMMEGRPETNNYLRGLNAEFRTMAPVFSAPTAKDETKIDQPNLFTWDKLVDGKRYLFVVRGEPFLTRGLFEWDEAKKSPSGKASHTEPASDKMSQHLAQNTKTFSIAPGDVITQEVFIEGTAPKMIALQFRTKTNRDNTWEHRAYWGAADLKRFVADATYPMDHKPSDPWHAWMVVERPAQSINAGMEHGAGYWEILGGESCKAVDGTPSMKKLGEVPAAGSWVTIKVPASEVGLEGQTLDGIAFTVDGGKAYWGKTAIVNKDGAEAVLIDGNLEAIQMDASPWTAKFTVPGVKSIKIRVPFENVTPKIDGNTFEDTFAVPYRARVYEITGG